MKPLFVETKTAHSQSNDDAGREGPTSEQGCGGAGQRGLWAKQKQLMKYTLEIEEIGRGGCRVDGETK